MSEPSTQAPSWLFVAAAKGIQGYVLRSDKLKEMAGASELVDELPELLQELLRRIFEGAPPPRRYEVLSNVSGSVRVMFGEEEKARQLARLWPVAVSRFAPGLESVGAVIASAGHPVAAVREGEEALVRHRNRPSVSLPPAGSFALRNRRTGLPATVTVKDDGQFYLDQEAWRKRQVASRPWSLKRGPAHAPSYAHWHLLGKVVPEEFVGWLQTENIIKSAWPLNFNEIVSEKNSYLAIVHADANGLGAAVMKLVHHLNQNSKGEEKFYTAFSNAIKTATEGAVRAALKPVCETARKEIEESLRKRHTPRVPTRPVVCAGEDITLVIRADLAIRFVHDLLLAFEAESRVELARLNVPGLREGLTACAGVVFCKSHYPFAQAYAVAESLCGFAKEKVKRLASAVAMHRITTSQAPGENYQDILREELSTRDTNPRFLSMNPYIVGGKDKAGHPMLRDLIVLCAAARTLPRGSQREMIAQSYDSHEQADRAFERLRHVAELRSKENWGYFSESLKTLSCDGLWTNEKPLRTPLYDALELQDFLDDTTINSFCAP
jgi:hypothetical protein